MNSKLLKLVLLASLAGAFPALSEDKPTPVMVSAGALRVSLDDAIFTQKKGYVHLLIDVFPNRAQVKSAHLANLSSTAEALVKSEGMKRFPKEKHFKVDVVEILERDEYGAPRWDQVKLLESYTAEVKGKKVKLAPGKAKK